MSTLLTMMKDVMIVVDEVGIELFGRLDQREPIVGVSMRTGGGSSWWGRCRGMLKVGAESESGVKLDCGGVRVKAVDVGALGGYKLRGKVR